MALREYVSDRLGASNLGGIWLDFVTPSRSHKLLTGGTDDVPFNLETELTITTAAKFIQGANGRFALTTANALPWVYDNQGQLQGIRPEGSATNLLTQSRDLSTMTFANLSRGALQHVGPDGVTSMNRMLETASTAEHKATFDVAVTGGNEVTASFFVRRSERQHCAIKLIDSTAKTTTVELDMETGATTATGDFSGYIATHIGDQIYRLSVAMATAGGATTCTTELQSRDAAGVASYLGSTTSSFFAGYGQIEIGTAGVSSWIETAGSTVARASDSIKVSTAIMSTLGFLGSGGTLFAEFRPAMRSSNIAAIENTTPLGVHHISANHTVTASSLSGNSLRSDLVTNDPVSQVISANHQAEITKMAYRYSHGRRRLLTNRSETPVDLTTRPTYPSADLPGFLNVGNVQGGNGARCPVRRIAWFNRGLSDNDLFRLVQSS